MLKKRILQATAAVALVATAVLIQSGQPLQSAETGFYVMETGTHERR
jgi:hypothetical protein